MHYVFLNIVRTSFYSKKGQLQRVATIFQDYVAFSIASGYFMFGDFINSKLQSAKSSVLCGMSY